MSKKPASRRSSRVPVAVQVAPFQITASLPSIARDAQVRLGVSHSPRGRERLLFLRDRRTRPDDETYDAAVSAYHPDPPVDTTGWHSVDALGLLDAANDLIDTGGALRTALWIVLEPDGTTRLELRQRPVELNRTALHIDRPNMPLPFWASGLESPDWIRRQKADQTTLEDPNGFYTNFAAYRVLKDMGRAAVGLTIADIVPSAGFIAGDDGRGYAVLPDGQIALLGETATAEKRAKAARIMLVA